MRYSPTNSKSMLSAEVSEISSFNTEFLETVLHIETFGISASFAVIYAAIKLGIAFSTAIFTDSTMRFTKLSSRSRVSKYEPF